MSKVVMPMVPVTAMPYAAARLLDVWKVSTSPMLPIINNQLTVGT